MTAIAPRGVSVTPATRSIGRLDPIGFVLLVSVVWSVGFRVIVDDHFQYLVPVRRATDSTFALNDWFAEDTTPFHYTFQAFLGLAARVDAIGTGLLVVHLLTIVTLLAALRLLLGSKTPMLAGLGLTMFVLRYGVQQTWGAVSLLGFTALPHFLGLASSLLTIALLASGRRRAAAVAAVVTAYLHVSVGAWTIAVVAAMVVWEVAARRDSLRHYIAPTLAALLAMIPLLLVVRSSFTGEPVDPDVYQILFRLRAPHHYVFSAFPRDNHIYMGVVLAVGLLCEHQLRLPNRMIRTAMLAIVGLGLMAGFFLHVVYWPLPVRLFPYRVAPILTALAAVCAVRLLIERRGAGSPSAGSFDPSPVVGAVGAIALVLIVRPWDLFGDVGAMVSTAGGLIVLVVLLGAIAVVWVRLSDADQHSSQRTAVAAMAIALVLTAANLAQKSPTHTFDWLTADQELLVDEIARQVPVGGLVMVSPDQSFVRFGAGRAVIVDFKAFPLAGSEMIEWRDRLAAVTGEPMTLGGAEGFELRRGLTRAYRARPASDLVDAASSYGATHLVVEASSPAFAEFESQGARRLVSAGGYAIVEVQK